VELLTHWRFGLLGWAFLALALIPLIPVILYLRGGRRVDEYELYLRSRNHEAPWPPWNSPDWQAEKVKGLRKEEAVPPPIYRKRRR
jgi:hypothetical protein